MTSRCPSNLRRLLGRMFAILLFTVALPAVAAAQTGTVTGTVTNSATNAPLAGRFLIFCTTAGCFATSNTNASGVYSVNLAPGNYVAYTSNFNTLGVANEIHPDIKCPGVCLNSFALQVGTPITVTSGSTVSGINFALDPGGSITGTITDASTGNPLQNVPVSFYTSVAGTIISVAGTNTDAAGAYTVSGLGTGNYYGLINGSGLGYTSELFDDILCPGVCGSTQAVNSGTPVAVTAGAVSGGVNAALIRGGSISGTVVNSAGSTPMQNVFVQAYTRIGTTITFVANGATNASGAFTIGGLPTGTYYIATSTTLAINRIYGNLPCVGTCSSTDIVNTGTPIDVVAGSTTSGKNFTLDTGETVSGTITDAGSASPVPSATVNIYRQITPTTGAFVASATTDAAGAYTVRGIPAGTYYALALQGSNFVQQGYGGVPCSQFACSFPDVFTSTPITVTAGVPATGKNFALVRGGIISGTLTNSTTGAPISGRQVFMAVGNTIVASVSTASNGVYTISGLPAGSYRLGTSAAQYANVAYPNVACTNNSCTGAFITANATPLTVTANATTTANFALAPLPTAPGAPTGLFASSTASGDLTITWNAPASGGVATSYILEAGLSPGATIGTLPVAGTGLIIPNAPPGTYYLRVRAVNALGTSSASTEFTVIVAGAANLTPKPPTNLVAWMSGGRLTMTWIAPASVTAPTSYVLEAGSAVGQSNLAVVELTTRSFTFDPIPSGFFFLRVRSKYGPLVSAPTTDVMINVGNVPAPPSPPQSLTTSVSGSTLTISWSAPAIGTATSYVIEAGTATGLSNIGVVDTGNPNTSLTVPGVPPGTYYLRVRAVNAQGTSPESNERSVTVQ